MNILNGQNTNLPGNEIQRTLNIGPSIRILQLNIEGLSQSKTESLARMLKEENIDIVVLQETHTSNENQLSTRGNINGFKLIGAVYHASYGSATYVKSSISDAALINSTMSNDVHLVTIKVGEIRIINVYKPPNVIWPNDTLPVYEHPAVYVGDFNSHHCEWSYDSNDWNGEKLVEWAVNNSMSLQFDAKSMKTFRSARWQREYNPDLCFVTNNNQFFPLQSSRRVIKGFPHTQHRPVIVEIGIQIPLINSIPQPRWNFTKANWKLFEKRLDAHIRWISPTFKNYDRFVGVVISAAKKSIPRGFRTEYIPGWNVESDRLYKEFLQSGETEIADDLLHSLDNSRQVKWIKMVENINFKNSSRKAWSLLRKLGGSNSILRNKPNITPDAIAKRIVSISRVQSDRAHSQLIKHELFNLKRSSATSSEYSVPFTIDEITAAIDQTKLGKAAGFDGIFPEFLKYSGKNTRRWLSKFFSNILETGRLPSVFKKTKVIAVLKPDKADNLPENYRPIALLSACYKLLERLIYNRISSKIEENLPNEQAGFRQNRNCTDQLLSLTSHIEAGFQRKLKTGAVFVDLTAAYDTVWREGVLFKYLKIIPCKTTAILLNNMLSNRMFNVFLNDKCSKTKVLNNGLPQGSVLAPLLFNLYIHDLPDTVSRKFGYADDWTLATQHHDMEVIGNLLSDDLNIMNKYFKKWRLCPSVSKTESSCFHLNNKMAGYQLSVIFNGSILHFNPFPRYLGVTLDRTLSYRKHLENTAGKMKTRNNIIQKLAGSTWGASVHTLRVSALALVYPVAEYGAAVWLNSSHSQLIDRQLNTTLRIITGTIKSTPLQWLPVLSHIAPSHLRRQHALLREHNKIVRNLSLPIHDDYGEHIVNRLKSRYPPGFIARELISSNFSIENVWKEEWNNSLPSSTTWIEIEDPTIELPGCTLNRRLWSTLNRVRTNHGRCGDSLFKWGIITSPQCDCGAPAQTIKHILLECPVRRYTGDVRNILTVSNDFVDWLYHIDVKI